MSTKKDEGPGAVSDAYKVMAGRWSMLDNLLGGTETMRAAERYLLPQHPAEDDKRYLERLDSNVLLNMTELTLNSLAGKPFVDPIKVGDDMPAPIGDLMDNVDLQGNNIDVFCRNWFRSSLSKAFSHVLVEFPRIEGREDGSPRTLEDDRRENLRPYWVHVSPENVLFAHAEFIDGIETLVHVRILEEEETLDGWESKRTKRIKVLTPGEVVLYEQADEKSEWQEVDRWSTGLNFIPFVTFYTDREAFMVGKPPLMDLAHLNVTHWQSSSDQRAVLTVARFPILGGSGVEPEDSENIKIGPYHGLYTSDPSGRFYYVEHSGAAISAGADDLRALEEQMANYGAEFLKKKPGSMTATARILDSSESLSPLQAMAIMFEDAVAQALSYTAAWLKQPTGGSVEVAKEFDSTELNGVDLQTLEKARDRKDVSRNQWAAEMIRRGVLDENYDIEKDGELIEQEQEQMMLNFGGSTKDLNPGGEDDGEDD